MHRYLLFILSVLLPGCNLPPRVPIETVKFPATNQRAEHLIILLSGRGAAKSYFSDHQWIKIARNYGSKVDYIAPYAHLGYYKTQSLLPRLNEDVIKPAKKLGYKTISIVGISLGSFGLLLYSERFPTDLDRLYSPYLGKTVVQLEIHQAGSLDNWQIKPENNGDSSYILWQQIKKISQDPVLKKKIFLGYGKQDKHKGQTLLASAIPAKQVITIPGGHRDKIFVRLWEKMFERRFFDQ